MQPPGGMRRRAHLITGRWRTTGTKDDMHINWPMRIAPANIDASLHFTCLSGSFPPSSPFDIAITRIVSAVISSGRATILSSHSALQSDTSRRRRRAAISSPWRLWLYHRDPLKKRQYMPVEYYWKVVDSAYSAPQLFTMDGTLLRRC